MKFRDQTAYIKAKREEALKKLGTNYVLHPEYDAVKNRHHSVYAEPNILKNTCLVSESAGRKFEKACALIKKGS